MRGITPSRTQIVFAPQIGNMVTRSMPSDELITACYQNEIPSFVKAEMERLYENSFSSASAEHVNHSSTSTYVVYSDARLITIFLFRCEKRQVKVLNATIKISAEEIHRFADYIFCHYQSVTTIMFQSIQTGLVSLPFPTQRFNSSEDIVVTLPDTAQAYLASLGKSTRKYIKYHLNRPKRCFPSYCYKIYENNEIDERLIQQIIDFNTARMDGKNKVSKIDEEQKKWIIKIAKTYGFVGVATINDRICAGVICSRVGANYFMHVIAHDPQYNEYRLGTLCCYFTICEAIARGGREYHFLWGEGEYKYRLLGVRRNLDNLAVYRSRGQYFFNLDMVLKNVFASSIRQLKLCLQKASADSLSTRFTGKFLACLYRMKWLKRSVAQGARKLVSLKSRQ